MIIVIDHFDSFVETLSRYARESGRTVLQLRQTASVRDVLGLNPSGIILSPGPGTPDNTGVTLELIKARPAALPILGICLGHQALAQALGGKISRAREPRHGKSSPIHYQGGRLFLGLDNPFDAGRYHSLIVEKLPDCLHATAHSAQNEIMAFEHVHDPLFGVQFHPESILTPQGRMLMDNFFTITDAFQTIEEVA
ncbi:MAG: aminodeoxychorismate/anthranilate synthase component II [Proteobacteria bacterium]|nr:aminodeoxychorismate/anthranilate synthase component II [Pseudomonadota bacterium]